jgi:hypothetical protein
MKEVPKEPTTFFKQYLGFSTRTGVNRHRRAIILGMLEPLNTKVDRSLSDYPVQLILAT